MTRTELQKRIEQEIERCDGTPGRTIEDTAERIMALIQPQHVVSDAVVEPMKEVERVR